jgi:hypothetical protein
VQVIDKGLESLHVPYSYGFSIIILTFLVKVATFPLTQKQVWLHWRPRRARSPQAGLYASTRPWIECQMLLSIVDHHGITFQPGCGSRSCMWCCSRPWPRAFCFATWPVARCCAIVVQTTVLSGTV